AKVTGLSEHELSAMAGRQLPFFSLIVPVWLVCTMAGWRSALEIWPALLICGGSFAGVQFLVANYHGPWLVDVAGGVVSLVALALFLRVWQPKTIWQFAEEPAPAPAPTESEAIQAEEPPSVYSQAQVISAWVPWVLLTLFVFLWGIPQVKALLGVPGKLERDAF